LFTSKLPSPPTSTLFPYTTLFRSPNGVLFGSTNAATRLRELLLTTCDLEAVISFPSGVFKPYSGVGTAALIFEKGAAKSKGTERSEEHTSELQSRGHLVCRLLLEK